MDYTFTVKARGTGATRKVRYARRTTQPNWNPTTALCYTQEYWLMVRTMWARKWAPVMRTLHHTLPTLASYPLATSYVC